MSAEPRVSVIVLTHNRPDELRRVLLQLQALPEAPATIVVDNASRPGLVDEVLRGFPQVRQVRHARNLGAAGRNAGVALAETPCIAFCDDDTWWAPGALRDAAALLAAHPGVAALSARVLVGEDQREDPTCQRMASSPLASHGLPGPALLGFMAGAAVMRREAFLDVGGYEPRFFLGAEEWLMALDFAARGWHMVYAPHIVTHHHPSQIARDNAGRRVAVARNKAWIACMRLPPAVAWRETGRALQALPEPALRQRAWREILSGLPWALRRRRVVPPAVVAMLGQLSAPQPQATASQAAASQP